MASFAGDIEPFDPKEIIAPGVEPWEVVKPGFFLPCDWSRNVRVTTKWDTSIIPNQKDGEARRARIGRPTRLVESSVLASNTEETSKQLALLARSGFSRTLFPLYPDQVTPVQSYSGIVFSVDVSQDLRYYRFEESQFVVAYSPETKEFSIERISSITANGTTNRLVFNPAVSIDLTQNSLILPLIQARLRLQSKASAVTDEILRSSMEGQELPGSWALPPSSEVGVTPAGFPEYDGLPVWTPGPNYRTRIDIEYQRTGKYSSVGVTQIASVYGDRMRSSREFEVVFCERKDYWDLLKLFDSRAGMTHPWWLPAYTNEYKITELTTSGCRVESFGPVEDWDLRPYISIHTSGGDIEIREIETVSTNGTEDILTFVDGGFDEQDLSNIYRAGSALKVRFGDDEIEEEWSSDGTVEVRLKAVELVEEKTLFLPELGEITTTGSTSAYDPVSCETDPTCEQSCDVCANCVWATNPTNIKVVLDFGVVLASSGNGLSSSLATYMEQNTPFDMLFSRKENDYFIFEGSIEISSQNKIDIQIRYDCFLGEWQWEYETTGQSAPDGTVFRACGGCTLFGGQDATGCDSTFSGGFVAGCWNSPRPGDDDGSWDIDAANGAERGCAGIPGWKNHTNGGYDGLSGFTNGRSAIMWGVNGEWRVEQDTPCCSQEEPCLQCVNDCLWLLNCNPEPVDTTTGCLSRALGKDAVDGGGVVTCFDCPIMWNVTEGDSSCCRGDGSQCPNIEVTMMNDCLFECEPDLGPEDLCPRIRN